MFRRIILPSAFLIIFPGLVLAKGKPGSEPKELDCDVFISSYDGGQIQCVELNGSQVKVTNIFENLDGSFHPEDLTQGPDKHLYVANTDFGEVLRINGDPSSNDFLTAQTIYLVPVSSPPFRYPQGPSFHQGDLYVSSENGVFRFDGVADIPFGDPVAAPTKIVNDFGTGEGTDFRVNGELLAVDRTGQRVVAAGPPFDPQPVSFAKVLNTFDTPIGIAVSPDDIVYVADFGTQEVIRCSASGCAAIVDFGGGSDRPYFIEHDFNGTFWVATEDEDGLGKVWQFADDGTLLRPAIALADFATKGKKPGAVKSPRAQGLAVPPTGATCTSDDHSFPGGVEKTNRFDCASYVVKVTMTADSSCNMTVKVRQVFPPDLEKELSAAGFAGSAMSDDYSNGLGAIFDDGTACTGDKTFTVFYYRFLEVDGSENPNESFTDYPAILRRDDVDSDWEETTISYVSGGILPDDAGRISGSRRSEITLADLEADGNFSEFFPPFEACYTSTCEFQLGSTNPVKFQIFDDSGDPVLTAEPRISIQEVGSNRILVPLSVPDDDNIARLAGGQQYVYNLKLTPDSPTQPGFIVGNSYRLIVIAKDWLGPNSIIFTVKD